MRGLVVSILIVLVSLAYASPTRFGEALAAIFVGSVLALVLALVAGNGGGSA